MVVLFSVGDPDNATSSTTFIKCLSGGIDLGKAEAVHEIYRDVIHDNISAEEGTARLDTLIAEGQLYGKKLQCLFAFFCGATIAPLSFGGSFLDMWISGFFAMMSTAMSVFWAANNPIVANIFEWVSLFPADATYITPALQFIHG